MSTANSIRTLLQLDLEPCAPTTLPAGTNFVTLTIPQTVQPKKAPTPAKVPTPNVSFSHIPNVPTNASVFKIPFTQPVNIMKPIPNPIAIEPEELKLMQWQTEWAQKAYKILLSNNGYIDTSRMRSGKTYVLLWLAKQFGFSILLICPAGVCLDNWKSVATKYGVHIIDAVSYQSLRTFRDKQPKHGYLMRFDHVTDGGNHQVSFSATQEYIDLVKKGVLVVFDEIQNIKNNSDQYKACSALLRPIVMNGGISRFSLLSGTPFDKEEHAVNLLKLIGYIQSPRLYNYVKETKQIVLEGIQELIDVCNNMDATTTSAVLAEIPLVKSKMNHICYTLYTRVIKPTISGAMPSPNNITGVNDVKNGFYNMTGDKALELQEAINKLSNAVRFNERTGTTDMNAENIGAVTAALVAIENAKSYDLARVATQTLNSDPKCKVVVCVNYTSTIKDIANLMVFFNPLILNGDIPSKKRVPIIKAFNEDPTRRFLIMNTAVGGVGISLYTPNSDSDRYMFMSPSYKLLEIAQAAARIFGPGMTANAYVRMFYGKGVGGKENNILNAMASKTKILKGTLEEVVIRDIVLPGDYESIEESDV